MSIIYKCLGAPEYECIIYTYNIFVNILLKINQMYIKIRINKNEGILLMDESLNEVKNTILNKNGSYLLEKEPLVVYPKKKDFLY